MEKTSKPVVFGFDFGTGSLGLSVRVGSQIVKAESITFDSEFASTRLASKKRRLYRTRLAHRAREYWWNEQWKKIGQTPLKEISALSNENFRVTSIDPRLLREFPKRQDNTVYNSALLRILILEGKISSLDDWQIYKAIHSAIQKRGYGHVPWKERAANEESGKETSPQALAEQFVEELKKMSSDSQHHFPCYFVAWKAGLWKPDHGILDIRINGCGQNHSAPFKASLVSGNTFLGYTAPRTLVETELTLLLQEARKRYPALDLDFVLYGPARKPFKDLKELSRLAKSDKRAYLQYYKEWPGLLAQKIPRFDNRILAKCALMPDRHVCRSSEKLAQEVHFLQQLHNLRFFDTQKKTVRGFTFSEYQDAWITLHDTELSKRVYRIENFQYKLGKRDLKNLLKTISAEPAGQPEIPNPKLDGRSRFCKPALYFLKQLYLSGKSPGEFQQLAVHQPCKPSGNVTILENKDPKKGLTLKDFEWLDILSTQTWNTIYIPDMQGYFASLEEDREKRLSLIFNNLKNPVVRHRAEFFSKRLIDLQRWMKSDFGRTEPDRIVIEIVRDDFMGEKRKAEYQSLLNERTKEREQIKKKLSDAGIPIKEKNIKKMLLLNEQKQRLIPKIVAKQDNKVATEQNIEITDLDKYQIAHIVPEAQGGPYSLWNLFLLEENLNREMNDRPPYVWLKEEHPDLVPLFEETVKNVFRDKKTARKRELLLSTNPAELSDRYQHLAESAWIARLCRSIVEAVFSWDHQMLGGKKKIHVVPGGLTARVRRKYRLNELLHTSKENNKNRDDDRHHALDAMVLSLLKESNTKIGDSLDFEGESILSIRSEIEKVIPYKAGKEKPVLEENFYGVRKRGEQEVPVRKMPILELPYKRELSGKMTFKLNILKDRINSLYYPEDHGGDVLTKKIEEIANDVLQKKDSKLAEKLWNDRITAFQNISGAKKINLIESKTMDEFKKLSAPYIADIKVQDKSRHRSHAVRGKGSHKGQFVLSKVEDGKKKSFVRPVYIFENIRDVKNNLAADGCEVLLFVQSGDWLELPNSVESIPSGIYRLGSLWTDRTVALYDMSGVKVKKLFKIEKFLQAGLRKIR